MKMTFETDCVHSTAELINAMVDTATEITWKTFRNHIDLQELKSIFPFYSWRGEIYNSEGELTVTFHIKDDWAVSFYKSNYNNKPCYFLVHSAIEYIFT